MDTLSLHPFGAFCHRLSYSFLLHCFLFSDGYILGKECIRKKIDDYSEETNWALYCLGTWHSHLTPSGPSGLDRQTARAVGLARLAPSVLLIHTLGGFRALLADSHSGEVEQ